MDEWYLDDNLWRDFYDSMFSPDQFALAAEQIEQIFSLTGGEAKRVLDLACGPGRHSLPLAERGCQVTAVDTSAFLLQRLREQQRQRNLDIELIREDMREFRREEQFDLAICMWTSFGYFDSPEDDIKVLGNIHNSLNPGGVFLLDVVGKEYLTRHVEDLMARELDDGSLLVEQPELVDDLSRMENIWTLIRDDQVYRAEFAHNIYTAVELKDRLFLAGFASVAFYGDLDGTEYDLESERLIAVASK